MNFFNYIKKQNHIAYYGSFVVLILFLLFGFILTLFFLQNFFISFKGFGLTQVLFFLIGLYIVFKSSMEIRFLIKNKNKFDKIFNDFIDQDKKALILTSILTIIFLSLFYSNIYLNFNFYINAVLYLPIFLLNNLVFIVNIFLLRHNLMFLTSIIDLVLPLGEIMFLFIISKLITKIFK